MKQHMILLVTACFFSSIVPSYSADVSEEIKPDAINARIRQHRMGELVVKAEPGAEVHVKQLRHEFWFGAALSSGAFSGRLNDEDQRKYEETFLANFNAAVTENALKWHSMERRQGQVNYNTVDAILAWTDRHEIPLRGHNIFWGIPNRVQTWQKEMDDTTRHETLKARALDVGRRYR
ncbi:MAG: endo-1,4-beta-xylanase, partial [Planctomycetota bacterium]